MMRESAIAEVAARQKENVLRRSGGLPRLGKLADSPKGFATIVTGVRRCGKSTLMDQHLRANAEGAFYLNFESAVLAGLELSDAPRIDRAIAASGATALYFDEVQQLAGWERYVRSKLDEGFDVMATGSNASLLGRELGTKLTGRHIDCELFPFDYGEFLEFTGKKRGPESAREYCAKGGFPAYLACGDDRVLEGLFEDVAIRDVAVRHGVRETDSLRRLAGFLVENVGCRISASKLRQPLAVTSAATVLKWCGHFTDAYLFDFAGRYSASKKVELANPRKVYCVDTGLQHALSASVASDRSRAFENMVYLALRREACSIKYYDEGDGECDFVPLAGRRAGCPVQATVELNDMSEEREVRGLLGAMRALRRRSGWIVTEDQEDEIECPEGTVYVVPFWKFDAAKVMADKGEESPCGRGEECAARR